MSAFSVLFEAGHCRGAHGGIDGRFLDIGVFDKSVELSLGGASAKNQTSAPSTMQVSRRTTGDVSRRFGDSMAVTDNADPVRS